MIFNANMMHRALVAQVQCFTPSARFRVAIASGRSVFPRGRVRHRHRNPQSRRLRRRETAWSCLGKDPLD